VKCHAADGTGSAARRRQPKIPNFTDSSWQRRRKDEQLMASILDGKGKEMPAWREKITEEQARNLVGHVRTFTTTVENPGQQKQEQPAQIESDEYQQPLRPERAYGEQPAGFMGKLIRWLGRFHPAAVHFPIGLLTAAAVAGLLRLATRQPAFDTVWRFCVWFGALTAVVAGFLGWFLAGVRLTDVSWVLTTHRWLGTSTVICAGLVLMLSEGSRRPDHLRTRTCFRVTLLVVALLVLATGFFGGVVVFGFDHYVWPR
jgi:uncharacterized membrane protein